MANHPYLRLSDDAFAQNISLADSYRLTEQFLKDYHSRGDTSVSDFLFGYAGICTDGVTTDPAALSDFVEAWERVKAKTHDAA